MQRILFSLVLAVSPFAHAEGGSSESPPAVQDQRLTLAQAVQLALANNVDLDIARTGPLVARETVEEARGAFDPVGFAAYGFDSQKDPTANSVQSAFGGANVTEVDTNQWNYTAGLGGQLPFGLSYQTSYNLNRIDSDSSFVVLEPQNQATARTEITLPLLRDFIHNEKNVTVKRSRIARQISEEEFRTALTDLIRDVERSYWELASTRANVHVAEKSLQTAEDLLEQTRVRHEVGVVSRVLVTQADAGVADREFQLIVARNLAGTAQDTLLNEIRAPDPLTYRSTQLVPEDPAYFEYRIDEEIAISKALRLRPELAAAQRRLEDADVQLSFAKNQRLPRLDLTASYSMSGISGTQKTRAGTDPGTFRVDPATGAIISPPIPDLGFDNGWRASNDDFFKSPGNTWSVAARFEIPLGNRTARHTVFQREIEVRRARSELKRTDQSVILDVRVAVRNLRSAIEGLEAAERRRVAQEETLRAEQERLRLGDSTPFQVLEFEEDLADAERQEITALKTYRNAVVEIERAQGTLPAARGISIQAEIER